MKEAGACNEKNAEEDKFLGVAHLFGEEEEESAGDKDNGEKVGAQSEKKDEDDEVREAEDKDGPYLA